VYLYPLCTDDVAQVNGRSSDGRIDWLKMVSEER
jgi:hypothetical protein